MIFNLYVAAVLAIAVFALIVGTYTAMKAYSIGVVDSEISLDERYTLKRTTRSSQQSDGSLLSRDWLRRHYYL